MKLLWWTVAVMMEQPGWRRVILTVSSSVAVEGRRK